MSTRYLCTRHFHNFCQNLEEAQEFWEQSMAMGLEAMDRRDAIKGERCFGTAYEIASLMFDRQISSNSDTDIAGNTLMSAQYLATCLVQQDARNEAARVLAKLHEKFNFVFRNPASSSKLRETLSQHLIPYVEKLYKLALGVADKAAEKPAKENSNTYFYSQQSTLLH